MTADAEPGSKTCSACHERKPMESFFPTGLSGDGYTDRCRLCVLAEARESRLAREVRLSH